MPLVESTEFPAEAIRDLRGVVRAMYAAGKATGLSPNELRRIAQIGVDLTEALDLAASTSHGTIGYGAAWRRAEAATERLGELVSVLTPAEPIITAARLRVSGARIQLRKKAPER